VTVTAGALQPPCAGRALSERGTGVYRLPVYLACAVLALLSSYLLGRDLMWDTLDYHLYAGFSALHDRFGQDYFAAGVQSYLNPYAYVPFYALVSGGFSALEIGCVLALIQSSILWLTYELALLVCQGEPPRTRLAIGLCAVLLAFLNPILIAQFGSSFADITTGTLVLAGWLLLARAVREPAARPVLLAGLIIGAACALKLTNAVHALAACVMLLLLPRTLGARVRYGLAYGSALALGFACVAAPWSWRLARTFGNPFFPLLNGVFRSPEFPTDSLVCVRFIPASLAEALWRPFALLDPVRLVQQETSAPDARYALLVIVAAAVAVDALWRRLRGPGATAPPAPAGTRVLVALGALVAVDWVLWLVTSANGRYLLPAPNVMAVITLVMLFRLLARQQKARNYVLAAILVVQGIQVCMGAVYRWDPIGWRGAWLDVVVPRKLATEPSLYLTIGIQANAFLIPYLAHDSGFVNFTGGYALGPQGVSGARIQSLLHRYGAHVRMLMMGERLYNDNDLRAPGLSQANDPLERFGLRVDLSDCATITVHGLPPPLDITFGSRSAPPPPPSLKEKSSFVSCAVVAREASDGAALAARARAADQVLDHLEDACPQIFRPRRVLTERLGHLWLRNYMNTDLNAWVSLGRVKVQDPPHGDDLIDVGRESDWARAPQPLVCGRRNGHYFLHAPNAQLTQAEPHDPAPAPGAP
jgi:hypothetical protein